MANPNKKVSLTASGRDAATPVVDQPFDPAAPSSLETAAPAGSQLPAAYQDMADDAGLGTENIGADDIRPPRLRVAQTNTPQVKRSDPKHIPGLQEGHLFNDLTGENYGEGPLTFAVVSRLGTRHVLFAPLEDGGGVLDFDVDPASPLCDFHTDPDTGKRVKPQATKFVDYLVWLVEQQELVALSLKGSMLKTAGQIDSLLRYPLKIEGVLVPRPPAWARLFKMSTASQSGNGNSWSTLRVQQVGLADAETRGMCRTMHEYYATKNVVVERDATDAEVVPESEM